MNLSLKVRHRLESNQQLELDQDVWHLELECCPECGAKNLKAKRCYSCGYAFQVEEENKMNQVESEIIEVTPFLDNGQEEEEAIARAHTRATVDVMENLAKSLSMQLWFVDMLQEGKMNEKQFGRLFAVYLTRLKPCLARRNEMLETAMDLEPLEAELNEAKLRLEELEMRRNIRDVSDDEYRVKMPAIKWDIRHYEERLRKNKADTTFLLDLKSVLSEEEITNLQEKAEKCIRMMDQEDRPWEVNKKITTKVNDALKEVQDCFDSFGYSLIK